MHRDGKETNPREHRSLCDRGGVNTANFFDVGYSSSSAFIAMFQQLAGTTPERFRKS